MLENKVFSRETSVTVRELQVTAGSTSYAEAVPGKGQDEHVPVEVAEEQERSIRVAGSSGSELGREAVPLGH